MWSVLPDLATAVIAPQTVCQVRFNGSLTSVAQWVQPIKFHIHPISLTFAWQMIYVLFAASCNRVVKIGCLQLTWSERRVSSRRWVDQVNPKALLMGHVLTTRTEKARSASHISTATSNCLLFELCIFASDFWELFPNAIAPLRCANIRSQNKKKLFQDSAFVSWPPPPLKCMAESQLIRHSPNHGSPASTRNPWNVPRSHKVYFPQELGEGEKTFNWREPEPSYSLTRKLHSRTMLSLATIRFFKSPPRARSRDRWGFENRQ